MSEKGNRKRKEMELEVGKVNKSIITCRFSSNQTALITKAETKINACL